MTTPNPNEDNVELILVDRDLVTVLSILPAKDIGFYMELNQPGSGKCKVHTLRSAAASLVEYGQFVRVKYRGALRGGFFIENIGETLASSGESADLWTPIEGRGALALLEDGIVWPDGTINTTRGFNDQTKAGILIALIDEAHERGTLSMLDYDFTASVDSNSVAWTDSEKMQFSVGKTLLDAAREISDMGIDLSVLVNEDGTFTLQAFANGAGADKSDTIYFRRGINCTDVSTDERGNEIANALSIKYENGFSYVHDAVSMSTYRRREKMIDAIDAGDSSNALRYGQAMLEFMKLPKKETSIETFDGMSPYVFVHYTCGDWVKSDMSGVEDLHRVRSIELSWQFEAEKAKAVVGLNSQVFENEIKNSNDIRKLQEQWRRVNDGKEVTLPFWAAIGKLDGTATAGTAIYAMAVSDAGILYVGGNITKVGNVTVGYAARYDIHSGVWSKLGDGFNGEVRAIACKGTKVYFGGEFTTADGASATYTAVWDEGAETLTPLTSTGWLMGFGVSAIAADPASDYVYFGGGAGPGGGLSIYPVMRYNSSAGTWYGIPGFVNEFVTSHVYAIAINGSDVYMGGDFNDAPGGVLWKWSGATLTSLGTSGGGNVKTLCVISEKLYIGGDFTDINSVSGTNALAVMDLSTNDISSLDGGLSSGYVYALATNGTDLFLGGTFTTIGAGFSANRIVSWNGGAWSNLATGLDDVCHALTTYNGNIGAGGVFLHAGEKPIKYLGAYITSLESLVEYLETGGGSSSGAYTHPNHSGDVVSAGDGAQTIQPNVVDNTKLSNMATGTVKARLSALTGDPEDVTLEDLGAALGVTPATYTADRVLISGSGTPTTDSNLTYDAANDRLELGIGVPANSNGGFGQAYEGVSVGHYLATWGSTFASFVRGVFARGTKASPTAVQAEDVEFRVRASAHDGSTYPSSNMEIRFVANQNQAAGAHGSRVEIYTTPDGSTTLTKAFTVQADGNVNIEAGKEYLVDGVPVGGGGSIPILTSDPATPTDGQTWYLRETTGAIPDGSAMGALGMTYTGNTGSTSPLQLSAWDDVAGTIIRY